MYCLGEMDASRNRNGRISGRVHRIYDVLDGSSRRAAETLAKYIWNSTSHGSISFSARVDALHDIKCRRLYMIRWLAA